MFPPAAAEAALQVFGSETYQKRVLIQCLAELNELLLEEKVRSHSGRASRRSLAARFIE